MRNPGAWRGRSILMDAEAHAAGLEPLPASVVVGRRKELGAAGALVRGAAAAVAWRHGIHLSAQSAVPLVTKAAAGAPDELEPWAQEQATSVPWSELVKPATVGVELQMVSESPALLKNLREGGRTEVDSVR